VIEGIWLDLITLSAPYDRREPWQPFIAVSLPSFRGISIRRV